MSEEITNIYKFSLKNSPESYFYSLPKKENYLGYDYYLLTQDENGESEVQVSADTINLLQQNNITLIKIPKNHPEYEEIVQKIEKCHKKEVLLRK